MPDHLIRLRRGWQLLDDESPGACARWVSLPTRWSSEPGRPRRLARRFGQPRLASPGETLWLRLDRVPGLGPISFNGLLLAYHRGEEGLIEIPLPEAGDRNELIVEVSLPEADSPDAEGLAEWGDIALVVRQSHG